MGAPVPRRNPPRWRRGPSVAIAILVLAAGLVGYTIGNAPQQSQGPAGDTFTEVVWVFSACWANQTQVGPWTVPISTPHSAMINVTNELSSACSAESVSLVLPVSSLHIVSSDLPLEVGPGQSATIYVTVEFAGAPEHVGPVELDVAVT